MSIGTDAGFAGCEVQAKLAFKECAEGTCFTGEEIVKSIITLSASKFRGIIGKRTGGSIIIGAKLAANTSFPAIHAFLSSREVSSHAGTSSIN